MNSIQRNYFVSEHLNNGINLRTAVATFTTEELENLKLLGDVICIDPAFDNRKTNWSMVPLTCIGSNRELLSACVIYSSSLAADFFLWVLHKLINKEIPCILRKMRITEEDREKWKKIFHDMCFTRSLDKSKSLLQTHKSELTTPAIQSFLNTLELEYLLFQGSHRRSIESRLY